jgi:RNA polymerase sigma-70 factor (ECF subfamily)
MNEPVDQASSALEAIVANFGALVRGVGWRRKLSDADIEEVVQEVRIRLWRNNPRSEQLAAVGASYIYRVAVSAALDIIRSRRTQRIGLARSIDDPGLMLADSARGPHAAAEAEELAETVVRAVDLMPASRRPVVRMYLAGYSREEIADFLGWSEAKTRNLLYRGLADLRNRLTEWGIGWEATE